MPFYDDIWIRDLPEVESSVEIITIINPLYRDQGFWLGVFEWTMSALPNTLLNSEETSYEEQEININRFILRLTMITRLVGRAFNGTNTGQIVIELLRSAQFFAITMGVEFMHWKIEKEHGGEAGSLDETARDIALTSLKIAKDKIIADIVIQSHNN